MYLIVYLLLGLSLLFGPAEKDELETLDLPTVLHLVNAQNGHIAAAQAAVEAERFTMETMRLWANPEVEVEIENFAGSDTFSGFNGAEYAVKISQTLPISGAQGKMFEIGQMKLSEAEMASAKLSTDIRGSAMSAFVSALTAQQRLEILNSLDRAFRDLQHVVSQLENAGRISQLDSRRVSLEYRSFSLSLIRAESERFEAQRKLFSLWKRQPKSPLHLAGTLKRTGAVPSLTVCLELLQESDTWKLAGIPAEIGSIEVERAQRDKIPDLTIAAGIRHHNELNEHAYIVGFGIELPLFNSGSLAVETAEARLRQHMLDRTANQQHLQGEIAVLHQQLGSAHATIVEYETGILDEASEVYKSVLKGYQAGRYTLMDVIDSQRNHLTVQEDYLLALEAYHLLYVELFTSLGMPSTELMPDPKNLINGSER